MTDWRLLRDAYGSADGIPAILARLSPDPEDEGWDALWSRLCHQGTVYSASFAALPFLVATMRTWSPEERAMPLSLVAAIVASDDVHGARDECVRDLDSTIAECRDLALESLASTLPDTDFIYVAQAVLALEGERLWGRQLDRLVDGEFKGACPSCGKDLFVVVGRHGFFLAAEEWVKQPRAPRNPIKPVEPADLVGVGAWLRTRAEDAGHRETARSIEHLFGVSTCPSCESIVAIEEALRRTA
jgi:hypothetical protein